MEQKIKKIVLSPIIKFVKVESLGGILLFAATIVALLWANSTFADAYNNLWEYKVGFKIGNFELFKSLILWINDGLMAIFFFLIGLEIKREILLGELNSLKKASLPIFAALGGVLIPVLIFMFLNNNTETTKGWGIPMATDIAFSLAILQVLGKRVPLALKIFLTAFAIVDDLVAVIAIAVFYSSSIDWVLIAWAALPLFLLSFLSLKALYNQFIFFVLGTIVWFLFLKSGIHPTIAGVLIALTIPLNQKIGLKSNLDSLKEIVDKLFRLPDNEKTILSKEQIYAIDDLEDWTSKVQSPLQQLEHHLHGWVAYLIIPIFALANAGMSFNSGLEMDYSLSFNLASALIFGKFLGIFIFAFVAVKTGLAALPEDINFGHIAGVGFLAGVGFTMAIFIANLAFTDQEAYIDASKTGILIGSIVSGIIGYLVLRFVGNKKAEE